MSAVKRWIYRHSSSSSSSQPKTQRGRSQSLDVQALERSGVRMLLQSSTKDVVMLYDFKVTTNSR